MPPDLLIDRSLGTLAVPDFFRSVWPSTVRTLDDVFGHGRVEDVTWMERADREGWIAVCKDDRIRTRPGERLLMSQGGLRVFCLANGNLKRDVQVEHFSNNLPALLSQAVVPGPWLCAVYTSRISEMKLYGA